jgi:hypothetical protein
LHWPGASVFIPASMASPSPLSAVSVVLPIFNEEEVLPELLARLTAVFDTNPATRWEALLVDDGSRGSIRGQVEYIVIMKHGGDVWSHDC